MPELTPTNEELRAMGERDAELLKAFILEGAGSGHRSTVKQGINVAVALGKQARELSQGREATEYRQAFDLHIDKILNGAGIGGRSFWQ